MTIRELFRRWVSTFVIAFLVAAIVSSIVARKSVRDAKEDAAVKLKAAVDESVRRNNEDRALKTAEIVNRLRAIEVKLDGVPGSDIASSNWELYR